MNTESLVKMIYNNLLALHNCGYKTWVSYIEQTLREEGFSHVWENQECNQQAIDAFSICVYDRYSSQWRASICDINKQPKLRTFCTFKSDLYLEPYLMEVRDHKLRKVISRFRLSSHSLEIEKGRHCRPKIPASERKCNQVMSVKITR
jgi:hypothetical protein